MSVFQAVQKKQEKVWDKASDRASQKYGLNTVKNHSIYDEHYSNNNYNRQQHPVINQLSHLNLNVISNNAVQPSSLQSRIHFNFANIQTKLKVSQPDDIYEQEADRVAEEVMRMSSPSLDTNTPISDTSDEVYRKCKSCEDEEKEKMKISRKTSSSGVMSNLEISDNMVQDIDNVLHQGGSPIDASTREFMESRFGYDFSKVRIHSDKKADQYSHSINATAFTLGQHIMFGEGQYQPYSNEGGKLLAHELTHIIQQDNARTSIQRQPSEKMQCPGYQPNEIMISYTSAGHLPLDIIRLSSDRLLIADFGVDWRHIKPSTTKDPVLSSWLNMFENDDSYTLSIIGYSDCVDTSAKNIELRQGRAKEIEGLLGPKARSRTTFRGMAALGEFVVNNDSIENRAKNRGVIIQFHQEYTFPPEEIIASPFCGPDVTNWLINEMNRNKDHPTIKTMREVRWPRWIPFFNIGWTAAALDAFANLIKPGGPWDFKANQKWWRYGVGMSCPSKKCDQTLTMCGMCFNYDVPGNIHFGWIGAAASLRSWLLHFGAGLVQTGAWTDDPKDAVAIDIGEEMWDNGVDLCSELRRRRAELNLQYTENCLSCSR